MWQISGSENKRELYLDLFSFRNLSASSKYPQLCPHLPTFTALPCRPLPRLFFPRAETASPFCSPHPQQTRPLRSDPAPVYSDSLFDGPPQRMRVSPGHPRRLPCPTVKTAAMGKARKAKPAETSDGQCQGCTEAVCSAHGAIT